MRTIKFRGYAHHQDKWVYGSLLLDGGEAWITETEQGLFVDMNHQMKLEPVEPETVGQFTGLTDKNNKEIYEGDVMRNTIIGDLWEVMFSECCYIVVSKISQEYTDFLNEVVGFDGSTFEVIGNIHQNGELMK